MSLKIIFLSFKGILPPQISAGSVVIFMAINVFFIVIVRYTMDKDTAANTHQWQCDQPPYKFLACGQDYTHWEPTGWLGFTPGSHAQSQNSWGEDLWLLPWPTTSLSWSLSPVLCKLTVRAAGLPPQQEHAMADKQGSHFTTIKQKNQSCWCASSLIHCLKPSKHYASLWNLSGVIHSQERQHH